MVCDHDDIVHHSRHVREDCLVLALEYVVRSLTFGADNECVVDETFSQRLDFRDFSLKFETGCYIQIFICHNMWC